MELQQPAQTPISTKKMRRSSVLRQTSRSRMATLFLLKQMVNQLPNAVRFMVTIATPKRKSLKTMKIWVKMKRKTRKRMSRKRKKKMKKRMIHFLAAPPLPPSLQSPLPLTHLRQPIQTKPSSRHRVSKVRCLRQRSRIKHRWILRSSRSFNSRTRYIRISWQS
jgi:hypothetical protein